MSEVTKVVVFDYVIILLLIYGSETWAITSRIRTVEMRNNGRNRTRWHKKYDRQSRIGSGSSNGQNYRSASEVVRSRWKAQRLSTPEDFSEVMRGRRKITRSDDIRVVLQKRNRTWGRAIQLTLDRPNRRNLCQPTTPTSNRGFGL